MNTEIAEFIRRATDLAPCVAILVVDRKGSLHAAGLIVGTMLANEMGAMLGGASSRIADLTAKIRSGLAPADRPEFEAAFDEAMDLGVAGQTAVRMVRRHRPPVNGT